MKFLLGLSCSVACWASGKPSRVALGIPVSPAGSVASAAAVAALCPSAVEAVGAFSSCLRCRSSTIAFSSKSVLRCRALNYSGGGLDSRPTVAAANCAPRRGVPRPAHSGRRGPRPANRPPPLLRRESGGRYAPAFLSADALGAGVAGWPLKRPACASGFACCACRVLIVRVRHSRLRPTRPPRRRVRGLSVPLRVLSGLRLLRLPRPYRPRQTQLATPSAYASGRAPPLLAPPRPLPQPPALPRGSMDFHRGPFIETAYAARSSLPTSARLAFDETFPLWKFIEFDGRITILPYYGS